MNLKVLIAKVEPFGDDPKNLGYEFGCKALGSTDWYVYQPETGSPLINAARTWRREGIACACGLFIENARLAEGGNCVCGAPIEDAAHRLNTLLTPHITATCGKVLPTQAVAQKAFASQPCPQCGSVECMQITATEMAETRVVPGAMMLVEFAPAKTVLQVWKSDVDITSLKDRVAIQKRRNRRIVDAHTPEEKAMGLEMEVSVLAWAFQGRSEKVNLKPRAGAYAQLAEERAKAKEAVSAATESEVISAEEARLLAG